MAHVPEEVPLFRQAHRADSVWDRPVCNNVCWTLRLQLKYIAFCCIFRDNAII